LLKLLVIALICVPLTHSLRAARLGSYWNFGYLHTQTECMVDHCDPYDAGALNGELAARAEISKSTFDAQSLVYPPSSLLALAPFELFRWPAAAFVFNVVSATAFVIACLLLVHRFRLEWHIPATAVLLATLVGQPLREGFSLGNPALLCIGFSTIAVLLSVGKQQPFSTVAAWLMLGYALALKPQLALAPAVLLLSSRATRATAAKACALFAILLFGGVLAYGVSLHGFHYLRDFFSDVRVSLLPGGLSDASPQNQSSYDFLNLQVLLLRVPPMSEQMADRIAQSITLLLAMATGWQAYRSRAMQTAPWTVLALLALLTLLPAYHRGYDRVIALLLIPAVVEIGNNSARTAQIFALLSVFWLTSDMVLRRWVSVPVRPAAELMMIAILLVSLARRSNQAIC
jgi:hypothetical protein